MLRERRAVAELDAGDAHRGGARVLPRCRPVRSGRRARGGGAALSLVHGAIVRNLSTDGMLLALAPVFALVAARSPLLVPLLVVAVWNVYRAASIALQRQHDANHDALTDLPNRRKFFEQLKFAHAHAQKHGGVLRGRARRPRRLQAGERSARPPHRRRRPAGGRDAAAPRSARQRRRRAARR